MSENEVLGRIRERMISGEPFTYSGLCAAVGEIGDKSRHVDRAIQKWRRLGLIEIQGRNGRAPKWVYIGPAK